MTVINKANIAPPLPPKEVVDVPELGGEVIVRGFTLNQAIEMSGSRNVAKSLSYCVIDNENQPIFTEQQWDDFGALNVQCAIKLFNKLMELSGQDRDVVQKK